jgi:hypothetical protein
MGSDNAALERAGGIERAGGSVGDERAATGGGCRAGGPRDAGAACGPRVGGGGNVCPGATV